MLCILYYTIPTLFDLMQVSYFIFIIYWNCLEYILNNKDSVYMLLELLKQERTVKAKTCVISDKICKFFITNRFKILPNNVKK